MAAPTELASTSRSQIRPHLLPLLPQPGAGHLSIPLCAGCLRLHCLPPDPVGTSLFPPLSAGSALHRLHHTPKPPPLLATPLAGHLQIRCAAPARPLHPGSTPSPGAERRRPVVLLPWCSPPQLLPSPDPAPSCRRCLRPPPQRHLSTGRLPARPSPAELHCLHCAEPAPPRRGTLVRPPLVSSRLPCLRPPCHRQDPELEPRCRLKLYHHQRAPPTF